VISSCGKLALKGRMGGSDVVDMTSSSVLPDVRMRDDDQVDFAILGRSRAWRSAGRLGRNDATFAKW
jgi:hypothetical protein